MDLSFRLNNPQKENFNNGKPPIGASLITNKDLKLNQEDIRGRILKRHEDGANKRYIRKSYNRDSDSHKSGSQRYWFLDNSNSEIPMSYRIQNNDSLTPYKNSKWTETGANLQLKNNLNKKVGECQHKSRPMSHTFTNSQKPPSNFDQQVISTMKDFEIERMKDIRSISRREKIDNGPCKIIKWIKRADTGNAVLPSTSESKLKLRKDLNDVTDLKYLISEGSIDLEYKVTSIILGSGSYAIVRLGEKVDNPEEKVAVKIYEKSKLFANKHRRKNLWNEIMVL